MLFMTPPHARDPGACAEVLVEVITGRTARASARRPTMGHGDAVDERLDPGGGGRPYFSSFRSMSCTISGSGAVPHR